MSTTRIGHKHQVTIPKNAFEKLHLEVGDVLEAEVQQGKLVLVPKRLMEKAPVPNLTARERKALVRARKKIRRIRQDMASARGLTVQEAAAAAKVGVISHDQQWWWTEEWQKGERETERDLHAGRTKVFENAEELIQTSEEWIREEGRGAVG